MIKYLVPFLISPFFYGQIKIENINDFQEYSPSIVNSISEYYSKRFDDKAFSVEKNDTIVQKLYVNITEFEGEISRDVIYITIPLKIDINLYISSPILFGDINNDNVEDIVIIVHREGWVDDVKVSQDIFTFINKNNFYYLKSVAPDYLVSGCRCNFRTLEIKNNFIIGTSFCYEDEDFYIPVEYLTKIRFINNKLEFHSKIPKN